MVRRSRDARRRSLGSRPAAAADGRGKAACSLSVTSFTVAAGGFSVAFHFADPVSKKSHD